MFHVRVRVYLWLSFDVPGRLYLFASAACVDYIGGVYLLDVMYCNCFDRSPRREENAFCACGLRNDIVPCAGVASSGFVCLMQMRCSRKIEDVVETHTPEGAVCDATPIARITRGGVYVLMKDISIGDSP